MIEMRKTQEAGKTPAQITVSMIDQDLKDGINKTEMAVKYGIKPWEVDEMFKHPLLKGRRPSRKKVLSFSFVDDMTTSTTEEVTVDPNQVTLEQAIDEAIETVEEVKDQMQETQDAIIDMLSPTEFETDITGLPKGELPKFINDTLKAAENHNPAPLEDDELELPSFEDTLDLVKEQQEEELEMDDDTFEL